MGIKKNQPNGFKVKGVLEALREAWTLSELLPEYGVHPIQIGLWKKKLIAGATRLFAEFQYGYRAKQCFWVRGQLFEGQKVCFLWFIQGKSHEAGVCPMPKQIVWETKVAKTDSHRSGHCRGSINGSPLTGFHMIWA